MLLNRETSGGRWRIRPDGPAKVSGGLAYLTDMTMSGMLHGFVLRSEHPHARIISINTDEAKQISGVHAVLTHLDIPGFNGFGIANPDQPVLCSDTVRYIGDAVACVAADSPEIARAALKAIKVQYEPLPVVDSPEAALKSGAPKLHPNGNVLHTTAYSKGDAEGSFAECASIVEETYDTPRQMHAYMETEGGLFLTDGEGRLTVYSPTQHGLKDRMQLALILDMPESDIHVLSSPIGGSFGGKDELNVQPYGALLAIQTGRPVKIHNSRWESVRAGLKKHPMRIAMKTGIDESGRLIAHQVSIIADTGAYSTLGAEVLNFATEHVIGPYRIDNVDVKGVSVFTNNGVSGEFRGFGGSQTIFAMEGQMDRLAAAVGMDPWELRRINLRMTGDPGPFGQAIAQTDGALQVWEAVRKHPLWTERRSTAPQAPWLKEAVGAAIAMHGAGLGYGMPDTAGGRLRLAADGKIEALFGYEEVGQGLIASLSQMLIERFGFAEEDLRIIIGDSDVVPDSGSTTASRATSMMWQTLQRLEAPFAAKLLRRASQLSGLREEELRLGEGGIWRQEGSERIARYEELARASAEELSCDTTFLYPATSMKRIGAHFIYTYSAAIARIELNTLTGRVKVLQQYHAVAAGPVANPQGYLGQIEGGSSMSVGFALTEDAMMEKGLYAARNLDTYLVPSIRDMSGGIEVEAIEELPEGDEYGPRGVGEIGSVIVAPAIAAAIREASGKWVAQLPVRPEELQQTPPFIAKAVNG